MAFNLADYQTVQERIEIFWSLYPNGRIMNDIVRADEKEIIVKCSVWKEASNQIPDTIDFAQEPITEKGINSTSALENCTTSATGRALSLLGGELSPSKKRASQTEMAKAARSRNWTAEIADCTTREQALQLHEEAKALNAPGGIISAIVAKGKALSENAPAGKEQTAEAQA